ncbi:hypothetical protein LguiB_010145 [Lonicera macranthoides]
MMAQIVKRNKKGRPSKGTTTTKLTQSQTHRESHALTDSPSSSNYGGGGSKPLKKRKIDDDDEPEGDVEEEEEEEVDVVDDVLILDLKW